MENNSQEQKTSCDGKCMTCNDQNRLYCALVFVKKINDKLDAMEGRMSAMENHLLKGEEMPLLNCEEINANHSEEEMMASE